MAKPTPGPWIAHHGDDYSMIRSSSGRAVAKVQSYGISAAVEDIDAITEANANLIAQSPDLLEACKDALSFIKENPPALVHSGDIMKLGGVMNQLRTVILKAGGE